MSLLVFVQHTLKHEISQNTGDVSSKLCSGYMYLIECCRITYLFCIMKVTTYRRSWHTFRFWFRLSDRVCDTVYIICPGTTFAVFAVACFSVFSVSIEVSSTCTPTTMLNSKENQFSTSGYLEALINGITSGSVVSSNSCIFTIKLWDSSATLVFPTSKAGVS